MLQLRVVAPYAVFRPLIAGSYRPTAPFLTPSAAYGLILNLAGIESRFDDGEAPMTLTRSGLPPVELALGAIRLPEVQSIYQQLHTYPVGTSGRDHAPSCKGAKYNIQPVRREFLSDVNAYICIRGNGDLEHKVRGGLPGGRGPRYGIPFLGDNSFMIDLIVEESTPQPALWFCRAEAVQQEGTRRPMRLTVSINRADMTRTVTCIFRPTGPRVDPPDTAWVAARPEGE